MESPEQSSSSRPSCLSATNRPRRRSSTIGGRAWRPPIERYDVALIFCAKALEIEAAHLPTRLLIAQIHDRGLNNFDAAVTCYRKVIALAGYESENPYCAAARAGLDTLTNQIQDSRFKTQDSLVSSGQS
jgi:hypothetical protein